MRRENLLPWPAIRAASNEQRRPWRLISFQPHLSKITAPLPFPVDRQFLGLRPEGDKCKRLSSRLIRGEAVSIRRRDADRAEAIQELREPREPPVYEQGGCPFRDTQSGAAIAARKALSRMGHHSFSGFHDELA
jgi:hypothetical protein